MKKRSGAVVEDDSACVRSNSCFTVLKTVPKHMLAADDGDAAGEVRGDQAHL